MMWEMKRRKMDRIEIGNISRGFDCRFERELGEVENANQIREDMQVM
jgi:hypothetical protein